MKVDDKIRVRHFDQLKYKDPRVTLQQLREVERQFAEVPMPPDKRTLRQRDQRHFLQMRQAALFCYGFGETVLHTTVHFAMAEAEAYDCVCMWKQEDVVTFTPVQLKELPPAHRNQRVTLSDVLKGLGKYSHSPETVCAIHVNRQSRIAFDEMPPPRTGLSQVWLFGAIDENQLRWMLFGDILHGPTMREFRYPEYSG